MTAPRILALDLSLTATGVCSDGVSRIIPTHKLRGAERLAFIEGALMQYVQAADVVVIEGYSYASPFQAHQVGELGGVIRACVWSYHKPCVEIPPTMLKAFATGKGNAGKDAMIAAAIRRFGFDGHDNNAADAFLLWHLALQGYGCPLVEVPKAQAARAAKVKWPVLVA